MNGATLGPTVRTTLALVAFGTLAALAAFWQVASVPAVIPVPTPLVAVFALPLAMFVVGCAYFAATG